MTIRNIAAVVSGMDEEYPYHIIRGINDYARENDINVSYFAAFGGIVDSKDFDTGEFSIYALPDFAKFDGVLLLSNTFANPEIRNCIIDKVKKAGVPAVIFECKDHEEFYDVSINNYSVMKKLVEHLIDKHGCRTFNFIAGPSANPEANDRYRAFRDALADHNIEFDERRLFNGVFRSYDGIKAIEEFAASGLSLPDAFVCANDSMALTAMSMLQRMGYNIPDDVIITGFDNTFNARNSFPALTTVKRPLYPSGQKAIQILIDLINGVPHEKSTLFEATPVFSESCGCTDEDIEDITEFKKNTYHRIELTYTSVHMLNRLTAGLAGAQDLTQCVDHLANMVKTLACEKFSICLLEDWENTYHSISITDPNATYSEYMTAPLVYLNGEITKVDKFESGQLFPVPQKTGGNINYFLPLHFDERCLGYLIMTNSDFPIYSFLCHTMMMSIGNAIAGISKLNIIDPLCKIYNRSGFTQNAEEIFKSCISDKRRMMISFIDLDGLKSINDNYGHKEGDFAIQMVAEAISSCCRRGGDICARLGGDEFIVLCVNTPDNFESILEKRFQSILDSINEKVKKPYPISASIGSVALTPTETDMLSDIITQADAKMYEVKKQKKANRK